MHCLPLPHPSARTQEMFNTLDVNLDSMVDTTDIQGMTEEGLPAWLGRMVSRAPQSYYLYYPR